MPPMGVCPGRSAEGASSGVARICARRSGEAPTRTQMRSSDENAICVCVRGRARSVPARSPPQLRQAQFHWGKPPPAAEPRILSFTKRFSRAKGRGSEGAGGLRMRPDTKRPASALRFTQGEKAGPTNGRLEFGVGVGTDFAVQVNFFVLRGGPFHGGSSFFGKKNTRQDL